MFRIFFFKELVWCKLKLWNTTSSCGHGARWRLMWKYTLQSDFQEEIFCVAYMHLYMHPLKNLMTYVIRHHHGIEPRKITHDLERDSVHLHSMYSKSCKLDARPLMRMRVVLLVSLCAVPPLNITTCFCISKPKPFAVYNF